MAAGGGLGGIIMQIIDGIAIARELREKVKEQNAAINLNPCLAIIVVGDDKESLVYVGLKEKAVEYSGGRVEYFLFPAAARKEDIIAKIEELNQNPGIDGILLQLPLPEALKVYTDEILASIAPEKDVDGFTPYNRGMLMSGEPYFVSCAALAAMEVIERYMPVLEGKKAVLVGDSFDLVLPLSIVLLKKGVEVDIIPDQNRGKLRASDIFLFEKGDPLSIKSDVINEGALVIDAGFHWLSYDKICGNLDGETFKDKEGFLLPVPGGLGPILISKLLFNLHTAARRKKGE